MAFWNRNDNGMGNRGGMGNRAGGMLGRAENTIRNIGDRGGYDRTNYGADRSTGGWGGDSYSPNMGNQGGMGGRFNNQYDRDITYRGNPGANVDGGIGRPLGYGYGAGDRDEAGYANTRYDRDFGARPSTGYDRGYGGTGGMQGGGNMYDRGYHSRHQVDNGDPFGDRQQQTPVRVMRGREYGNLSNGMGNAGGGMMGSDRGYDRGYGMGNNTQRFSSDRVERENDSYRAYQDYSGYSRGLNYEPYYNAADHDDVGGRPTGDMGFREGYDQNHRNRRDRDWF